MSKFMKILFVSWAILLLSQEIKGNENGGLILTFVQSLKESNFAVGPGSDCTGDGDCVSVFDNEFIGADSSESIEIIEYENTDGDRLILYREIEVNYSDLTTGSESTFLTFDQSAEITTVELKFRKRAESSRAYRLFSGTARNVASFVVEVPESNDSDILVAKVYGRYVSDYSD